MRKADRELEAIYARVPSISMCQGLCHTSCGLAPAGEYETARIGRATGRKIATEPCGDCTFLTPEKRCEIYALRPFICRLWGTVENMRCPYGCIPDIGRWLTVAEGFSLTCEAMNVGVDQPEFDEEKLRASMETKWGRRMIAEIVKAPRIE